MKYFIGFLLITGFSCLGLSAYFKLNQSEIRTVVIFHADWCGPCQKMKKTVWPHPKIQELIKRENYVLYRSNVDHSDMYKKYEIKAIPAIVILDGDDKVIKKHEGYMDVLPLYEFLNI